MVTPYNTASTPRDHAEGCSGSREPLLEGFAAAATADHDAALGEQPRDRAADRGLAGELAVAVPDRTLKRQRDPRAPLVHLNFARRGPYGPFQMLKRRHIAGESCEWAIQDSNLGPLPYQRSALTD